MRTILSEKMSFHIDMYQCDFVEQKSFAMLLTLRFVWTEDNPNAVDYVLLFYFSFFSFAFFFSFIFLFFLLYICRRRLMPTAAIDLV